MPAILDFLNQTAQRLPFLYELWCLCSWNKY